MRRIGTPGLFLKIGEAHHPPKWEHEASLALSDDLAESVKDGAYTLEINGKDVVEVLSIELKGVDRVHGLDSMNSRVAIKSRHRPKGLLFRHLTDNLAVTFDRHAAR